MTKEAYISGVMRRLNELGWDDSFSNSFAGSNTTHVEQHVVHTFRDAWRKSVLLMPRHYFKTENFKNAALHYDVSTGVGLVVLPDDFYILSLFLMEGWKRKVFSAVEETSDTEAVQSNYYIRGNFCRPVCTMSIHPEYGRVLNYYSLPKGVEHKIEEASYVPLVEDITELNGSDSINIDELLEEPLQWINASVVFDIFEKKEQSKLALENATTIIS